MLLHEEYELEPVTHNLVVEFMTWLNESQIHIVFTKDYLIFLKSLKCVICQFDDVSHKRSRDRFLDNVLGLYFLAYEIDRC